MPRWAHNKLPSSVQKRYFELVREGHKGAAAARMVGVSTSCGSLWFIDAGRMVLADAPVSARFLTQDDRIAIADGIHAKVGVKEIAASIGKSFQTVYREIQRNSKSDGRYQPWWAHNQALLRRGRSKEEKIRGHEPLRTVVRDKLTEKWSPQQISRFLTRAYPDLSAMQVCAESIYKALYAGLLGCRSGKLRTGRSRRKPHRRGVAIPNKIKNMKLLDQRPAEVTERRVPGHWEGDLIIGQYGAPGGATAIGTLVERVTKFLILVHLPDGYKAPQLRDALIAQTRHLPESWRKTLTWDQGREMSMHEQTAAATGFDIYFCDPHSPWQRGLNENTNGLIRQYFPKHTDLSIHTAQDLQTVAAQLNQRPRLALGDRTPAEAMRALLTNGSTS
ncbi:IS30 family transposase [Nonomuraea maheshkhaliensis]|uniref:IS30 family transposase n=1 Tax=Nonomuraea maheshkhaliensis TaxID=419590 RepID=A0ABP4TCR8_9ACTN